MADFDFLVSKCRAAAPPGFLLTATVYFSNHARLRCPAPWRRLPVQGHRQVLRLGQPSSPSVSARSARLTSPPPLMRRSTTGRHTSPPATASCPGSTPAVVSVPRSSLRGPTAKAAREQRHRHHVLRKPPRSSVRVGWGATGCPCQTSARGRPAAQASSGPRGRGSRRPSQPSAWEGEPSTWEGGRPLPLLAVCVGGGAARCPCRRPRGRGSRRPGWSSERGRRTGIFVQAAKF
ncbi:hypothetical protein BS78_05G021600 [Paspalum vaginatum]|nr:hypothetical protein BS78_05G021600 [Paspalum vaginatum]